MTNLWTFENKAKLEQFGAILKSNDIAYETGDQDARNSEVTMSVNENDFQKAKRLLLKYRQRRTSRDSR